MPLQGGPQKLVLSRVITPISRDNPSYQCVRPLKTGPFITPFITGDWAHLVQSLTSCLQRTERERFGAKKVDPEMELFQRPRFGWPKIIGVSLGWNITPKEVELFRAPTYNSPCTNLFCCCCWSVVDLFFLSPAVIHFLSRVPKLFQGVCCLGIFSKH